MTPVTFELPGGDALIIGPDRAGGFSLWHRTPTRDRHIATFEGEEEAEVAADIILSVARLATTYAGSATRA